MLLRGFLMAVLLQLAVACGPTYADEEVVYVEEEGYEEEGYEEEVYEEEIIEEEVYEEEVYEEEVYKQDR